MDTKAFAEARKLYLSRVRDALDREAALSQEAWEIYMAGFSDGFYYHQQRPKP